MGGSAGISAIQGIQAGMRAFDRSAAQVTGSAAQLSNEQAGSPSDMIDGMVGMHFAGAAIKANIAVLKTADEMLGSLLDMKA